MLSLIGPSISEPIFQVQFAPLVEHLPCDAVHHFSHFISKYCSSLLKLYNLSNGWVFTLGFHQLVMTYYWQKCTGLLTGVYRGDVEGSDPGHILPLGRLVPFPSCTHNKCALVFACPVHRCPGGQLGAFGLFSVRLNLWHSRFHLEQLIEWLGYSREVLEV